MAPNTRLFTGNQAVDPGQKLLKAIYHCLGCHPLVALPWAVFWSPRYLTSITWPTIGIPTKGSKMCPALSNSQQKFQCTCLSRGGQELNLESNLFQIKVHGKTMSKNIRTILIETTFFLAMQTSFCYLLFV